jgi:excisionase family DNA binding protein
MGEKKQQQLWDTKDVVNYLRLPVSTVKLYIATNKIPSIKIGRHRRFIPADVERALKKLST